MLPRRQLLTLIVLSALATATGCAHPAERALQGTWEGRSVENFDDEEIATATGWARGTSFEFAGSRLTVSLPAEDSRTGTYRLSAIEDRRVTLAVLGADGSESEMSLIVDDAESLRWDLGGGRSLVMKRR